MNVMDAGPLHLASCVASLLASWRFIFPVRVYHKKREPGSERGHVVLLTSMCWHFC